MMSLRSKVLALVEVVLRVPPLFVVDEFLKISLGLPVSSGEEVLVLSNVTVDHVDIPETDGNYYDANFYNAFFFTFFKFVVCCLGCMSSLCVFVLYTKHLVVVYLYLISLGLVFISYWINVSAIKQIQALTQAVGSAHPSASMLEDILNLNVKSLLNLNGPGFLVLQNFFFQYGLSYLFKSVHLGPHVPCVLRVFWVLRVAEHAFRFLMDTYDDDTEEALKVPTLLAVQSLASMAKSLLVTGCETITAVLGMTSVISFFCHYIGNFFQWILLTDEEEDKSIGTVSAILFYILALQTGLTSLNPEKRFIRLCRNFCLLFTALLHFLHNIVNPILMSLSASHNPSTHRHVRALGVCAFLILFPISLLVYLWSQHSVQDRCPLCHDILYKIETDPNKDNNSEAGNEENSNNQNLLLEEEPDLLLGDGVR
ncbi:PREDICTED: protein TRC8 homolog [Papilio polytes]|uniref:protein TRC8 homolog n=1 Tax=Papilio polytes TaxID=76194 RepID=UPI0006767117|nr:PREDICTED: protein TRC8 homolog [Papilio polytes]